MQSVIMVAWKGIAKMWENDTLRLGPDGLVICERRYGKRKRLTHQTPGRIDLRYVRASQDGSRKSNGIMIAHCDN